MDRFWRACQDRFEKELSAQQFKTWIKPLRLKAGEDCLTILVPNQYALEWIKDRFLHDFEEMASAHFSSSLVLCLALQERELAPSVKTSPSKPLPAPPLIRADSGQTRLNPAFSFDSLVSGKANEMARGVAMHVAERPGASYNPLFVYGGVGLGKTHLIQACLLYTSDAADE